MRLSPHFTLSDATFSSTAVRLGIDNTPSEEQRVNIYQAVEHLEEIRKFLGFPIHVDSWLRCTALNDVMHGSNDPGGHVSGWAIDFICPQFGAPLQICKAIAASGIKFDKLVNETGWTHISFHPAMRQIVLTAHFNPGQKTTYTEGLA